MTRAAHQLVETLLAARNVGSSEQVRALLAPDATHWDCLSGRVQGLEAVTQALVAGRAGSARPSFVAERFAAAGGHAVVELRVWAGERSEAAGYLVTEVYELRGGLVAGCRAYLDPAEVRRA